MRDAVSKVWAIVLLSQLCLGASCDSGRTDQVDTTSAQSPAASGPQVTALPQVDVAQLTDAERDVWISLINQELSPCGEPISVGRCVNENAACARCVPGARYLARLVADGAERVEIEEHYRSRFNAAPTLLAVPGDSPVRGAAMATVTIVEYSDFQCPFCGRAHPLLVDALREFSGKVKMVFKHYPLSGHVRAMPAARAAEAARIQGKFWEMHDMLFEHQSALEDADLERYASQLGLDLARFRIDLASPDVQRRIEADRAQGASVGVEATPTLFLNGRKFEEHPRNLAAYLREELEL
jgi:glutaredoxin